MRYELSDEELQIICKMLPSKPRGVPRWRAPNSQLASKARDYACFA
jgi:hypothetical protein